MNFVFNLPVHILFGRGAIQEIGKCTAGYGKKALIVTGKNSTKKTGLLYKVIDLLQSHGVDSVVFDKVEPNPLTTTVRTGVTLFKEQQCEVVIGLGGGSSMDCAKGIAFCVNNPLDIDEYVFGKQGNDSAPLVLVTTTAGTGSEGNSIAVLTNPETKDKKGMKNSNLYSDVSIVDPDLFTTLPPSVIASTGFDALSHCIEAYVSKKSQPLSDGLALQGIRMLSENLVRVYDDPLDTEAWEQVAAANTIGGMVIDMSGISLQHGMEHPLSGLLDVTHAKGLAAVYPAVLKHSVDGNISKFKDIAIALGETPDYLSDKNTACKVVDAVEKFLERIDMRYTLKGLGVEPAMIEWLARNCVKVSQPGINNNPVTMDLHDIMKIYAESM